MVYKESYEKLRELKPRLRRDLHEYDYLFIRRICWDIERNDLPEHIMEEAEGTSEVFSHILKDQSLTGRTRKSYQQAIKALKDVYRAAANELEEENSAA